MFASWLYNRQESERWIKIAEATADRAGANNAVRATVLKSRIVSHFRSGHADKNLELHKELIALLECLYGEDDSRVAKAIRYRGNNYSFLHQPELALADARRALELLFLVVGPNEHLLVEL